jgi:UDP-N-acetylmuramate: L-alanyl-gamma-D-glutamyl-meso-diaminopimelate ligase
VAVLPPLFHAARLQPEERLDLQRLARELGDDGTATTIGEDYDGVLATMLESVRPGDVAICMSSGSFGGLPQRLLAALREAGAAAAR